MGQCECVVKSEVSTQTIPFVRHPHSFSVPIAEAKRNRVVHLPNADFWRAVQGEAVVVPPRYIEVVLNYHTRMINIVIGTLEGGDDVL